MEDKKFTGAKTKRAMIEIFKYPHDTLMQKSTIWNTGDTIEGYDDIEKFESDMVALMRRHNGIGLAANQIGITRNFSLGANRQEGQGRTALWLTLVKVHGRAAQVVFI